MKQILILFTLLLALGSQAQNKMLKGRIVDQATQAGIAYTNIGVEGTFYGTASDADGFFELKVPAEFQTQTLFISAVGYQNQSLRVADLLLKDFARIALVEQTYDIEGIDVAAQSRVLYRIIRTAAERVPQNYHSSPVGMTFHYLGKTMLDDSTAHIREAIVDVTDAKGYSQPGVKDAYDSRNYRFTQVNKNFDSYSFGADNAGFDELLEQDLARLSNTVFSEKLLNDYDLYLDGISAYQGDSVWIISYKPTKIDLAHTGDYYATKMEGKLYILKSNYALVRSECVLEASRNNAQNRSLLSQNKDQQQVRYHLTTLYQRYGGKYLVSYLDQDKRFTNAAGQEIKLSRKAALLDFEPSPQLLTERQYFENTDYNQQFWNSFHSKKKL
ncbi:carboxypeptidase-like regulatory domain-containing protein [Mangrovibacterium marinum]|uniref:Carboxypeptidase-like protein n=1 Tax=Mangrovibacterium marinum TaxID=1639118 RepID=A0A2T5C6R9_9BACT|nr:carboxypeptidase-like regulatory domain-containing protein [Mangrovibacterium marinum]PTN10602.1 carboxypeptidase-like protein [Mangrovibacterium marinum]